MPSPKETIGLSPRPPIPPVKTQEHQLHVAENEQEYSEAVKNYLLDIIKKTTNTPIFIGVSGGSMPQILCPIFNSLDDNDVERLHIFAVDERIVPTDSSESNTGIYLKLLPEKFKNNVLLVNCLDDAKATAIKFERTLRSLNVDLSQDGFPQFDVLFLGIGPDGHTCSLFPGHKLLEEQSAWIKEIEDSPKPPLKRVTVTLPVLNSAQNLAFLVTGENKANVMKGIIEDKNLSYTPALIKPQLGHQIHWFLDKPAASKLKN